MSLFFLLNNLHFSLEILGALAFLIVAWLALDSFLVRRDFLTATRGIGFALLAAWQVVHAFGFTSDAFGYIGYILYVLGVIFVLWNILLEIPVKRPEFKAILIVPAFGVVLQPFTIAVTVGLSLIALLSFIQYKRELKKTLLPFWVGFLFLALGALTSLFYIQGFLSTLWVTGHMLELAGFFALGWWVWSYLALRIREEMLLIFISSTLFMAVIVSLTFSSILIGSIEAQTKMNLLTNARVLDLAVERFKEESLAKARLLAVRPDIKTALARNDFEALTRISTKLIEEEKLGFLSILDQEGYVVLRAHALTQKDDNLRGEVAVGKALEGESFVTIESSPAEKFSIRAASPIFVNNKIAGVLIAGFPLDNAFADNMKRITGLEMSVFEGDVRVATTALNPDGRTRSVGIKQTDPSVLDSVLQNGNAVTLRTTILSRPFLASYLPLKNAEGEIIGMLSAAQSQRAILETAQVTNRLTLIVVMVIMIILIMPIYLITRRLSGEIS